MDALQSLAVQIADTSQLPASWDVDALDLFLKVDMSSAIGTGYKPLLVHMTRFARGRVTLTYQLWKIRISDVQML